MESKKEECMNEYIPLLLLIGVSFLLSMLILGLSFVFSTQKTDPEKISAYECGFDPFDDARARFDIRFYLVAILFIIFDLLRIESNDFGILLFNVVSLVSTVFLMGILYKFPEWYVVNTVGVLVGSGVIVMIGIAFVPVLIIIFMILAAIYDHWAVNKSKHMLELADTMIDLKLPVLLVSPKESGYSLIDNADSKIKKQVEEFSHKNPVESVKNKPKRKAPCKKITQDGPKLAQDGTNQDPRTLKGSPRELKMAKHGTKKAQGGPHGDPIWPIAGPRWLQAGPRDAPRASQQSPTWPTGQNCREVLHFWGVPITAPGLQFEKS